MKRKSPAKRAIASKQTDKTRTISAEAKNSVQAFLDTFDKSRTSRRATGGMSTDKEQDLLRAMLVFAAAGLDSVLKRLIRDSILDLSRVDSEVRAELEDFISSQIKTDSSGIRSNRSAGFLATILASALPLNRLIELYIDHLTGTSLQSADEVARTIKALGLEQRALKIDIVKLKKIFEVRNDIIHELDINLDSRSRRRNIRRRDEMKQYADELLRVADSMIGAVEIKLKKATA